MPSLRFPTAFGDCALGWSGDHVTHFDLPGSSRPPAAPSPPRGDAAPTDPPPWVTALVARVRRHLAGQPEDFTDVPYAFERVSSFQREVYLGALKTKSGQTSTYGQLARAIGQPLSASRAVGTALGQNPWPLLVPCHRFVGADGRMTGFSGPGGIATKLRLLALEGSQLFDQ